MSLFNYDQLYNAMNVPRSKSLFREFYSDSEETILSISIETPGHPALRDLFLKHVVDDPSEATFALEVFGTVAFWDRLQKAPFLKTPLKEWRHECDVLRKSKAFQHIVKEVQDEGKNAYQAAKFLIDEPWKPKSRPVKRDSQKSTEEAAPSHVADLTEFIKNRKG